MPHMGSIGTLQKKSRFWWVKVTLSFFLAPDPNLPAAARPCRSAVGFDGSGGTGCRGAEGAERSFLGGFRVYKGF